MEAFIREALRVFLARSRTVGRSHQPIVVMPEFVEKDMQQHEGAGLVSIETAQYRVADRRIIQPLSRM